jgi:hypothetical protein
MASGWRKPTSMLFYRPIHTWLLTGAVPDRKPAESQKTLINSCDDAIWEIV